MGGEGGVKAEAAAPFINTRTRTVSATATTTSTPTTISAGMRLCLGEDERAASPDDAETSSVCVDGRGNESRRVGAMTCSSFESPPGWPRVCAILNSNIYDASERGWGRRRWALLV